FISERRSCASNTGSLRRALFTSRSLGKSEVFNRRSLTLAISVFLSPGDPHGFQTGCSGLDMRSPTESGYHQPHLVQRSGRVRYLPVNVYLRASTVQSDVPLGIHFLNGCGFVSVLWDIVKR